MADFWFDANIFIESKRRAYGFDIAPGFWHWIQKVVFEGRVRVPKIVWDEVCKGEKDQLARFLQAMSTKPWVTSTASIAAVQGNILAYVHEKYPSPKALQFGLCGDSWLIAHAMDCQGTVVTYEGPGVGYGGKVQIPDVCKYFSVKQRDIYSVSRELGLKLILSGTEDECS